MELSALDTALNGLVCYAEVYADLRPAQRIYLCARALRDALPTHFAYEEQLVLEEVATLGPPWKTFVMEMRRQHLVLQKQLEAFLAAADALADAADLEEAVAQLTERGRELSRNLRAHMSAEERRLSIIPRHS